MPETTKDYYDLLGVSREATPEEIKKAFRRKARECHPDTSDHQDAEEQFKQLNEAYEVLSDPQKRETYDRFGTADPRAGGGGYGGFEDVFGGGVDDLFSMFFGGMTGAGGQRVRTEGRDMGAGATVTLREAAEGVDRQITYVRMGPCETCDGAGFTHGGGISTCSTCGGTGQERQARRTLFGTMQSMITCRTCSGTGTTVDNPCSSCQGEGRARVTTTADVRIPPGARDGSNVRVSGLGEAGLRGDRAGDLVVTVRVEADEYLYRDGDDLHARARISFTQAALGATIKVAGLVGLETVKIPAGAQHGDEVRVKRSGVPRTGSSARGDLIVHLSVEVPRKLDRAQRKLLEQLSGSLDAKGEVPLDHVREWLR